MATIGPRFTVADLVNMPEDGNRYEVIAGELSATHAPHADHLSAIGEIEFALRAWDRRRERGWPLSGAGVMLAFASAVLPALLWVSRERLAQVFLNAAGEPDGKLHAAPDLVVAVLSPGPQHQQRDRETQLKRYSRRGVCASWLVDRGRRQVAVYRRRAAARLELTQTLGEGDPLTSPLLPGVARPGGQSFVRPAFFAR